MEFLNPAYPPPPPIHSPDLFVINHFTFAFWYTSIHYYVLFKAKLRTLKCIQEKEPIDEGRKDPNTTVSGPSI